MTDRLPDLCAALLDHAARAGAEAADVLAVSGTSLSIDVRAGALEQAERSEGVDLGLRVLIGGRQASVSASDTSADTLAEMAARAVAMSQEAPADPHAGLADANMLSDVRDAAGLELEDPSDDPAPQHLQDLALRAEAAALAHDGISQVDGASAQFGRRQVYLAASNGFAGGYGRTDHGVSCVAITGEGLGMERDYAGEGRIHAADMPPPEEVGNMAAERTLARTGARKPPTGAFPVLYDERISSGLIGHLLSAISGTAIARGSSWARGLLGEQVLPAGLDVVEDPHRVRATGSRPFDAEGLRTRTRSIVADGVLTGWTLDLATARKLGLDSTANAARGTSGTPSPATWNIALTQGGDTRDALIAQMGTGLVITSLMGASINPNTGDYSRGASGFWVENGEIAYPVNECTVAGNLIEMLKSIHPANDARPHLSRVVPSLLVEGVTIAGN